jgi:hypothetical protein
LKYHDGQPIEKGDLVRFHGEPGRVEFIADRETGSTTADYCFKESGPGAMVVETDTQSRHYVLDTENAEDLVLVARQAEASRLTHK